MPAASERQLGEPAYAAVRAFAGTFYAQSQPSGNEWMLGKASEEYGRAVGLLREELSSVKDHRPDLLLAPIMALIYHDVSFCNGLDGSETGSANSIDSPLAKAKSLHYTTTTV